MKFASTYKLYQKIAKGELRGLTVPAFNLKTLVFDSASALFRAAKKQKTAAFIIELAQSEMAYTNQTPEQYAQAITEAAKAENWSQPIFLQGDHFKCLGIGYPNIKKLENLIKQAIGVGFYNIDIDCSALPLAENIAKTNYFADFINSKYQNINISIGGEIGEIGGQNTTIKELEQFLKGVKGIIKVAVQTGTSHGKGGEIDWPLLEELNQKAKQYGLAGIVQHGASMLPDDQFKKFPKAGVCEIHLATELMNVILESNAFPQELKEKIGSKKDLGPMKERIDNIPQKDKDKIAEELEEKFKFFFKTLGVANTADLEV